MFVALVLNEETLGIVAFAVAAAVTMWKLSLLTTVDGAMLVHPSRFASWRSYGAERWSTILSRVDWWGIPAGVDTHVV